MQSKVMAPKLPEYYPPIRHKLSDGDDLSIVRTTYWTGCRSEAELDEILEETVEAELSAYETDLQEPFNIGDQKWNAVSQLQKAIRRGQADLAKYAAQAIVHNQRSYVIYRMNVIAGEEIGVADIPLNCLWLWAARQKIDWWRKHDPRKVISYFAERMALTLKSREGANCMNLFCNGDEYKEYGQALNKMNPKELMWVAHSEEDMVVAAMAGFKLFVDGSGGDKHHDFGDLMMAAPDDTPIEVMYATKWGCRRNRELQHAYLPWLWKRLKESSTLRLAYDLKDKRYFDLGWVGPYRSEALDMHTQDGKRALAYFNAVTGLREEYEAWGVKQKVKATGFAVFRLEGEVVDRRLCHDLSSVWKDQGWAPMLYEAIGRDHDRAMHVLRTVYRNREALHRARLRVTENEPTAD